MAEDDKLNINSAVEETKPKRYRCKNGHEQITHGEHDRPFSIRFSILNPPQEKQISCCPLCLADALAKIAVPMEEVLDDA